MVLIASNPPSLLFLFFFFFFWSFPLLTLSGDPHAIAFRSPNLYPEGLAWDPSAQHFLAGSLRGRSIAAVSDAGVVETLISDPSLPANATFLGLAVDTRRSRILAAVHAFEPLPPFDALAAYDLRTRRRLFLALLSDPDSSSLRRPTANDVAVDSEGNAFVTNSAGNFIWKVSVEGEASIFSRSPVFTATAVDPDAPYSYCGLNGIAYVSKGYLLAVQSNTGKMFKVDADDGTAREVPLTEELTIPDGIALRGDGVAVVVSPVHKEAWFVKSDDSWGQGVVYDKTALDREGGFPTSVAVGGEGRVYAIYGHVEEGMMGNAGREWFGIQEIRAESESGEESVWVFVLIGLGLTYFLFWRFQMAQLVKNINKKTN